MTAQPHISAPAGPGRAARYFGAVLLALTGLFTLALVLNHPVLAGRHDVKAVAVGIQALARVDRLVHGYVRRGSPIDGDDHIVRQQPCARRRRRWWTAGSFTSWTGSRG